VSAGTSSDRTTSASSRTPNATRNAIWTMNRIGSTDSAMKVAARTTPAEVITDPVTDSARKVPALMPNWLASSRTRVIRKML